MPEGYSPTPVHLKPAAPLAERVLLPGDPHRALQVAQHLLERPRMLNHHRGLWGYTGEAADGELLSVQSTGMGGPSTAVVVEELVALGVRELVRIGTCASLDPELGLGTLVVARSALARDGTSVALGAGDRVTPDAALTETLAEGAHATGLVATSDLFYDERPGIAAAWREEGALAVEMEAAVLFRLAELRGARAGCLLAVSDLLDASDARAPVKRRERIARDELEAVGLRLGELGAAALVERVAEP